MIWIWTIPPEAKRLPFAHFGDRQSRIPSYEITSSRSLAQQSPSEIILLAPRVSSLRLSKMHFLPSYDRCPLVDDTLIDIVGQYAEKQVQFMPVTVRAKDGDVLRFSYARPLLHLPCMDVEKSDIDDWIIPGEEIMDARLLVFKPDCLGDAHIARDTYTSHVVVSEQLKNELLATGDPGLNFCLPENMWNIFGRPTRH
jgi:hypothetical protein